MNYIKRYDGYKIDSEELIPFPVKNNKSISEMLEDIQITGSETEDLEDEMEYIDPEFLNPYAVGHKINHPPPEVSQNVSLIDFDIPYTWFPSEYMLHLPYADYSEGIIGGQSRIRKDVLRGVAIVASRFIEDGEELYWNYFEDERVPHKVTADWLVIPPPISPYLEKK